MGIIIYINRNMIKGSMIFCFFVSSSQVIINDGYNKIYKTRV